MSAKPLRMSERLNLVLGARLDCAIDRLRDDPNRSDDLKTVNATAAKMVLVALADWHGQDGRIFPDLDTIASTACASRATAIRAVKLLEYLGLITVQRRFAQPRQQRKRLERSNLYTMNWDRIAELGRVDASRPDEPVADCNLNQLQIATSASVKLTH